MLLCVRPLLRAAAGGRPRRTWCSPLSPAASPPTHARLARPPSAPHPHRAPPAPERADVLVCPLCAAGDTALAANEDCCCACCIAPSLCIFPCYWAHVRQAQARKYSITDPLSTGALGALLPCLMFTFGCRALAAGGAGCGASPSPSARHTAHPRTPLVRTALFTPTPTPSDLCLITQQLNHAKAVQLSGGLQGIAPQYPAQQVMH